MFEVRRHRLCTRERMRERRAPSLLLWQPDRRSGGAGRNEFLTLQSLTTLTTKQTRGRFHPPLLMSPKLFSVLLDVEVKSKMKKIANRQELLKGLRVLRNVQYRLVMESNQVNVLVYFTLIQFWCVSILCYFLILLQRISKWNIVLLFHYIYLQCSHLKDLDFNKISYMLLCIMSRVLQRNRCQNFSVQKLNMRKNPPNLVLDVFYKLFSSSLGNLSII